MLLALLLGCMLSGALLYVVQGTWDNAAASHAACLSTNTLRGAITGQLQRSLIILGKPGGAAYQFYHAHPGLLQLAHQQIVDELRAFAQLPC